MTRYLITADDFLNSGLPVSDDIRHEEVEFAISTVERNYIKPFIGEELYAEIVANPLEYESLLDETDTTNGIRHAECEMVFAWMLYDRMRLTRYTTVVKDDEHSENPSKDEIMDLCSTHWEIGLTAVIDALTTYGHEPSDEICPQPPFFELAFPIYQKPKHNN